MREKGEKVVILDGRTPEEYHRMNIPGGIAVPNAELVYRVHDLAPDPDTTVVVSCPGRPRSIIGAQALINAGLPNRVVALRGGTMGWRLAGLELEHGSDRKYPDISPEGREKALACAEKVKSRWGVKTVDRGTFAAWKNDENRTTYLLDVRSREEYEAGHLPGSAFAPGGQLVQGTDQWCGTRGARILLLDDPSNVRAVMTAHWLLQMGWEVYVLEGGVGDDATETGMPKRVDLGLEQIAGETISAAAAEAGLKAGDLVLADVDVSAEYVQSRLPGAVWGCRPRAAQLLETLGDAKTIVVYSMHETRARVIVHDLRQLTDTPVMVLAGGREKWLAEGRPTEPTPPGTLSDAERIDFLFWVHDRHLGNDQAARDYLEWEEGLPAQIEADGDATYNNIVP